MVKAVDHIDKVNKEYSEGIKKYRKEAGMGKKAFEKLLKLYVQNIRNSLIYDCFIIFSLTIIFTRFSNYLVSQKLESKQQEIEAIYRENEDAEQEEKINKTKKDIETLK